MAEKKVIFGGRLAEYKYYDMDKVIESAFKLAARELGEAVCSDRTEDACV